MGREGMTLPMIGAMRRITTNLVLPGVRLFHVQKFNPSLLLAPACHALTIARCFRRTETYCCGMSNCMRRFRREGGSEGQIVLFVDLLRARDMC